jgi:hypothetical protein
LSPPLLQVDAERESLGQPLSVKEGIAGLNRSGFSLPVDQDDLDDLPGQAMLLEEGAQIGLPLLAPMMHDDPPRPKLKQVQRASPDDDPDYPLWVGSVERRQPLAGAFKDRLVCIFQRPANGIAHAPRSSGFGVKKPESRPSFGTQASRQEERCYCGNSGL